MRNREKQRKRVESSSLWTHGPDAYVAMVSRYGVVWRGGVLVAINHGLPHCSPVNHRTRGTRELPSVK